MMPGTCASGTAGEVKRWSQPVQSRIAYPSFSKTGELTLWQIGHEGIVNLNLNTLVNLKGVLETFEFQ